jgi:biotin carboxyl carrier protein
MLGIMTHRRRYTAELGGLKLQVSSDESGVHIDGGGDPVRVGGRGGLRRHSGTTPEGRSVPVYVEEGQGEEDHEYVVYLRGEAIRIRLVTPRDERLEALRRNTAVAGGAEQILRAPMPGLLKMFLVEEGSIAEKGESLCILEAMKMENEIKSPDRLRVTRRLVEAGGAVEKGTPLVELSPPETVEPKE